MKQLYQFVGPMRELVYSDPYKLSSIITLLDMSVGSNKKLTSTERVCVKHFLRLLVKSAYQKINFLISQPKHMLWVLKRTVSMRRFF